MWRIPKTGEKLRVNPEFNVVADKKNWNDQSWYAPISDGKPHEIESMFETEHMIGIKFSESLIEIVVLKENGRLWWASNCPQVFLLEEE